MSVFRLFGSELSPYSVKVRSYLRYKGIDHEWILRTPAVQEEFSRYARLPLIPLLVSPQDVGSQDSTPILRHLESEFPEPSIVPQDPTCAFVSDLLEEYADEWCNKQMFHLRWWRPEDQQSAGRRIAEQMAPPGSAETALTSLEQSVVKRMVSRLHLVGSSEETKEQIENSFRRQIRLLDEHLQDRAYLLGNRPGLADFAWWAQIYEAWTDPTGREWIGELHQNVSRWINDMLAPQMRGSFEPWQDLEATLRPVLEQEVAGLFLPWSRANAAALARGDEEFEVMLEDRRFVQQAQKYHARSLAVLADRWQGARAELPADHELLVLMAETGCAPYLDS